MRAEPASARPDQLVDFVVADPVVLGIVEDRQQDIQVIEGIGQPDVPAQVNVEIARLTPVRNGRIQRDGGRRDLPAERLEQAAQQVSAAAARDGRQADRQRHGGRGQVRTGVAPAGESGPEHVLERHRQHAGRGVRAVVDVLSEGEPVPRLALAARGPARPDPPRAAARRCTACRRAAGRRRMRCPRTAGTPGLDWDACGASSPGQSRDRGSWRS